MRRLLGNGLLRHKLFIACGLVAGALGIALARGSLGWDPLPSSGIARASQSTPDGLAATTAWAKSQGQQAFADRAPGVQGIMQRMYTSDASYRTLDGLFVVRAPGKPVGSVQIHIEQPSTVRTAAYSNDDGEGSPEEIYSADGDRATYYSPGSGVYTSSGRAVSQDVPDLASVPLGLIQPTGIGTTLSGIKAGAWTVLADMYVHPSTLITCPFFTTMSVDVVGRTTYDGRQADELVGTHIPTAMSLRGLGNAWRMWVDARTGIVLHVDYYEGSTLIGWAGFKSLTTDGGSGNQAAWLSSWALPAGARAVGDEEYRQTAAG